MGLHARQLSHHQPHRTRLPRRLGRIGPGPRGYDIALLYAYVQLAPCTAAHMHHQFVPLLDSASGRATLLMACAKLLQSSSRCDHPDLTPRLWIWPTDPRLLELHGVRLISQIRLGPHINRLGIVVGSNSYKLPLHCTTSKGGFFARTSCCPGPGCRPGQRPLQCTNCFGGGIAVHQHGPPLHPAHHRGVRLDAPPKAEGQVRDGEVQGCFPVVLAALAGHVLAPPRRQVLVQVDRLNAGRLLPLVEKVTCLDPLPARVPQLPELPGDSLGERGNAVILVRVRGASGRRQRLLPMLFT